MLESNENYTNLAIYNLLVEKTKYNWTDCSSLPEYLKNSFANYNKHITSLQGDVKYKVLANHEISVGLHHKINEVVFYYLRGKIPAAFDTMQEAFVLVNDLLIKKSTRSITKRGKFVFKARVHKDGKEPPNSREDMFHIPFENRELVQGQRFSAHGIPSVYLGESIYDCYLELGKPDMDKFWVSLFYFPQETRLVDLTFANQQHDPWLILHQVNKDDEKYAETLNKLADDILLWPLIMACSIVCKYPDAPFKQEYIIPQMLYQLCNADNKFDGVKYYSTKLDGRDRNIIKSAMINYAMPAQDIRASGYCPALRSKLCLTEPITTEVCQNTPIVPIKLGYFTQKLGFPLLSVRNDELKKDETILALDKMTIYFEQLLMKDCSNCLSPLDGFREG